MRSNVPASSSFIEMDFDQLRRKVERTASLAATLYDKHTQDNSRHLRVTTTADRPCLSVRDMLPKKRARANTAHQRKAAIVPAPSFSIDYPTIVMFNTAVRIPRIQNFLETHGRILSLSIDAWDDQVAKDRGPCISSPEEVAKNNCCTEHAAIPLSVSSDTQSSPQYVSANCKENLPHKIIPSRREQGFSQRRGRAKVVRPEGATVRNGIDIDVSQVITRYLVRQLLLDSLTILMSVSRTRRKSGSTGSSSSHLRLTTMRLFPYNGYMSSSHEGVLTSRDGLLSPGELWRTAIPY